MGRVNEDIVGEKDNDQIVDEQAIRHLFYSRFLLRHEKPCDVGR